MKFINSIIKLSLISTFVLAANANAITTTWGWDLTPGSGACTNSCSSISASDTENGQTITAGIKGYADTTGNNDADLESGKLHYYSGNGWGLVNQDENGSGSQHAFDNLGSYVHNGSQTNNSGSYLDYDMALVSFDTSVALTGINFGWTETDADFTILAFNMSKDTSTVTSGNWNNGTWADVNNSANWLTVGHYNYNAASSNYYAINTASSGQISSQYWLVGAYNSIFTGALETKGSLDLGNDKFKIRKLQAETSTTTPPEEVPAPTALGLLLVGALGIYARRNKKTA